MTFIDMLVTWQWLVLAAIPPAIVALYFLKLKRRPMVVPSTFLWRKSLEDLRVNSLWQRMRANWLLLLQLLLVALAMGALARPGWRGNHLIGHRFVFLIDASASMSAIDVTPSRLEEAKRRAGELVTQMASGDVAMIISFSDSARVEQPFTDNHPALRRRLTAIEPTNHATRLDEALRLAAGLAGAPRTDSSTDAPRGEGLPATLYIFSDGKFPDVQGFQLGQLQPVFVPLGSPGAPNVAIVSFSTRRQQADRDHLQAFARLVNNGPQDVAAEVELYRDDELLDADKIELEARGSGSVVFDIGDLEEGVLRLQTRSGGALMLDDQAWAVVEPAARAKVLLVTPGNDPLELALNTDSAQLLAEIDVGRPDILAARDYQDKAAAGYYALVIYDRCQPAVLPEANTMFIGGVPPNGAWSSTAPAGAPRIIDVETAHPLFQLLDLSNVRFAECRPIKLPSGGTVLIDSDAGPLAAIAPRRAYEDAVLGAEIIATDAQGQPAANTDWPLRLSFPVFVLNALDYFGGSKAGSLATGAQPGGAIVLHPSGTTGVIEITSPSGQRHLLARNASQEVRFSAADGFGVYRIDELGEPTRRFAVNLFDTAESDIEPRPDRVVGIGYVKVAGEAGWEGGRREWWKALLLGALAILGAEWYIYTRRIGV